MNIQSTAPASRALRFLKHLGTARFWEYIVGATFIVILVYLVMVSFRITAGISQTLSGADHRIRLQVLNGCGVDGLARRTMEGLSGYNNGEIEIVVVDTDNFELHEIPRSFIISREADVDAARHLARSLGLNPSDVTYQPLEHNDHHVSVTLVLGEDYENMNLNPGRQGDSKGT
jgi:hypothetical protein